MLEAKLFKQLELWRLQSSNQQELKLEIQHSQSVLLDCLSGSDLVRFLHISIFLGLYGTHNCTKLPSLWLNNLDSILHFSSLYQVP